MKTSLRLAAVREILDAHMRELDGNCFCGFRTSGKPGISAEEWLEHILPLFGPLMVSQTSQQTMCSADIGKAIISQEFEAQADFEHGYIGMERYRSRANRTMKEDKS